MNHLLRFPTSYCLTRWLECVVWESLFVDGKHKVINSLLVLKCAYQVSFPPNSSSRSVACGDFLFLIPLEVMTSSFTQVKMLQLNNLMIVFNSGSRSSSLIGRALVIPPTAGLTDELDYEKELLQSTVYTFISSINSYLDILTWGLAYIANDLFNQQTNDCVMLKLHFGSS